MMGGAPYLGHVADEKYGDLLPLGNMQQRSRTLTDLHSQDNGHGSDGSNCQHMPLIAQ